MSATVRRKPAIELVDTTNLSREDWLKWRTKGIGGSDLAAIMGFSPWSTAKDIYRKKKGIVGALEEEADNQNWVAKEVGNLLEPLVAKIFAHKTGFVPYEDKKMYAHPDYPFMLANLDYRFEFEDDWTAPDGTIFPAGTKAILECKTSNHHSQVKWDDGAVPMNYEYQGRHYMCVMDVDVIFFACLFSNNEDAFTWSYVTRDLSIEEDIIAAEADFWQNYVETDIEPPYTEDGDLVLQSIRNFYGHPNKDADVVELSSALADVLLEIEQLKASKSKANKTVDSFDDQIKRAQAIIVEEMGVAAKAVCKGDDGVAFEISNNPQQRDNLDKDGLKAHYPQAYERFVVKKHITPKFTVKRVKAKAS